MRLLVGLVSAVLGALAGWFALALTVIAVSGPDRDGGIAMGAFFGIGPIGAVAGLVVGLVVFRKLGFVRATSPSPAEAEPPPADLSRPYAAVVLSIAAVLAAWVWFDLLR